MNERTIMVVGGGAAGYFAAIAAAAEDPSNRVVILERASQVLAKVRISGGGRCNVTHACFDPAELVTYYPRGAQALRGPFSRFQPQDTVTWFEQRGVALKTESDGRMFPTTDQSQTIIDCLQTEARRLKIQTTTNVRLAGAEPAGRLRDGFILKLESGDTIPCDRLILATGSHPSGWEWSRAMGHRTEPPVPSLFTFTIDDPRLTGLSGLSVPNAELALEKIGKPQRGPLLITHWGLSGPAVLRLSAWNARALYEVGYQTVLKVNYLPDQTPDELAQKLNSWRSTEGGFVIPGKQRCGLPERLWTRLVEATGITTAKRWRELSNELLRALQRELQAGLYPITGRSAYKDEFVTCGGIVLKEVDFRTMESKLRRGLYFAGEILDIDAVTGGFNFQSAWTTGWIAGKSAGAPAIP